MRIINITTENRHVYSHPMCACIGYFDGMHLGHKALIDRTVELADQYDCETALITFDPDPWVTIKGQSDIKHITTFRQRINLAVKYGIENIVILKFTQKMSRQSPEEFLRETLGKLNLKALVCGFDFHYGYQGKGDSESLKRDAEYEISVVDAVTDSKGKISSSRISEAIEKGSIAEASAMLGYTYQIDGTVIHGRHKGTGIGFPTVNISYSDEYLLPKTGVYAGYAVVGRSVYQAMINIGHNPTINYTERLSVEAHLIGYSGDLYGRIITLQFIEYLRPEKKFRNKDNLVMQLEQDVRDVRKLLNRHE